MNKNLIFNKKIKKIWILGNLYEIRYMDKAIDVDFDKKDELRGMIDLNQCKVNIFSKRDISCIWKTLWHEIIHGIGEHTKIYGYVINKYEEQLTENIAVALNYFLRFNVNKNKFYKEWPDFQYKLFGETIEVVADKHLKNVDYDGLCDFDRNVIRIDESVDTDRAWSVFWHEFIHYVVRLFLLQNAFKNEEKFATCVGVGINDVIVNNF